MTGDIQEGQLLDFEEDPVKAHGSGVSVLSESRDSVIGGVRVQLALSARSLATFKR